MCYMDRPTASRRASPGAAHAPRAEHGTATRSTAGGAPGPDRVGVRELRQNLSVYLRRVEAGETLEVTEHGRAVARLGPLPPQRTSVLDRLIAEGKAFPGRGGNIADWEPLDIGPGPTLSEVLQRMREEDDR
jgi:prevent-host-death family protein